MIKGYINKRGGALLISLALLLMLTIAAIVAVDTAQTDIDLSFNQLHSGQAFYTAEAGLNRAFVQLNDDNDWNTGYAATEFEDGQYWVAIIDSFVDPALVDTVIIRSTGHRGDGVANLEALMVPEYFRPFQYAVFSDQDISLGNNTCTDSYDSEIASYADSSDTLWGDIASNGTVTLDNITTIGGNVSSAIEDGVDISTNAEVFGDTASNVPESNLEPITQEDLDWAASVSLAPIGFTGDYTYDATTKELIVDQDEILVLSGGVYFFSSIMLENHAQIQVAPGEQAIIYMTDSLVLEEAAEVNTDSPPSSLAIFSTGDIYTMGQDTEISIAFYGPDADLVLENSCEIYGSIVANSIDMDNIACVHYDRALGDFVAGKTGVMTMIAWREK